MTDQAIENKEELPSLETTRQAIIEMLVKHHVIGARESVDRLILAAQAASLTYQQWQPIDSAPKDGTKILGYWAPAIANTNDAIDVACFMGGEWRDPDDLIDGVWSAPTFWMLLPDPPVQPKASGALPGDGESSTCNSE